MRYAARRFQNVPAITLAVMLSACAAGPAPKLSPVGNLAVQARAVIQAADAVVTGIDAAMTAKQLPAAVGIPVLQAIRQVGQQGQVLGNALADVELATTAAAKQQHMTTARATLATIQAILVGAGSQITDPATRTQVQTLLKTLTDAVATMQQLLPAA